MFNQNIKRVGFACMIMNDNELQEESHKIGSLTQKKMNTLSSEERYDYLIAKVKSNLDSFKNQITYVSELPPELRMFRISSTLLPMYDHPIYGELYADYMQELRSILKIIGDFARENDVRLSMHPDQFCVINSDKPHVVEKSIKCLEMHSDMARMLGYGKSFQDFKINIHLNGSTDVLPIDDLSETSKMCLTLENDEKKGNIERLVSVCEKYGIAQVFDIHHHWCNTDGSYMDVNDPMVDRIIATWKGVRPTMHLSQSVERIVGDYNALPNFEEITKEHKKGKTFAHSDYITNQYLVDYMRPFNEKFDIMVEAKMKNLASFKLHRGIRS